MEEKFRTKLAHTIIELKIASKDMRGILNVIGHFKIQHLDYSAWNKIVAQIRHEDIIAELTQKHLQRDLLDGLKLNKDLKNLVFFSQAFNLPNLGNIAIVADAHIHDPSKSSGADLLFAAKELHGMVMMKNLSLEWARRAKEIALSLADSETFLGAVDFLNESAKEEDVLHLLEQTLKNLMEKDTDKTSCRFVLPECKKCLALLKRLPAEEGKRLEEIIFKK